MGEEEKKEEAVGSRGGGDGMWKVDSRVGEREKKGPRFVLFAM